MTTLNDIKTSLRVGNAAVLTDTHYIVMGRKIILTTELGEAKAIISKIKSDSFPDWKSVSHALRAGYQALHIYVDGDYEYPLPETEFLRDVKAGKLDYTTQVGPALEEVVLAVEKAAAVSTLPKNSNHRFWKKWLLDVYKDKYI